MDELGIEEVVGRGEETVTVSLGGDYVVVQNGEAKSKPGTIYLEARMKDNTFGWDAAKIRNTIEDELSSRNSSFDLWEDLLANEYKGILILGDFYYKAKDALESLKVVEYVGPKTDVSCYSSNTVKVNVQVYQLHSDQPTKEDDDLPQGEITTLPHVNLDGRWDELVFDDGLKENLIWMMTNILRFSQRSGGKSGEINPLILLHGLPGTGKTSLCQGLAQKISIRLNSVYKETKLIEIKTATLLSRYYSESAKQVDEIFTAIERMCRENNERFICVLIDEVESIANSRDLSAKHGEAQDSVRVTNALLTGLDRTKACPNLIFLCTSNMFDCLDAAFLDRCGLRLAINPPSAASRYAIVRGRVQKLINRRIISSELTLPSHRDAVIDMDNKELPGSKLLYIVELINSVNSQMTPEGGISGRRLAQLPEQALLLHLRGEDCGLELALSFIEKFVLDEQSRNKRLKTDSQMRDTNVGEEEAFEGIEVRGQKRKLKIILEEDCDMEELQAIIKLITTVPSQTQKRKRIVRIEKEDEKA